MDIEDFKNAPIGRKVTSLIYGDFNKYYNYVISDINLLSDITLYIAKNAHMIERVDDKLMNKIIDNCAQTLLSLPSDLKITFCMKCSDANIQDRLFELLNIEELLSYIDGSSILEYFKYIKNIDSFKRICSNINLIEKILNYSDNKMDYILPSIRFGKLETEKQEFLYNILKEKCTNDIIVYITEDMDPSLKLKFSLLKTNNPDDLYYVFKKTHNEELIPLITNIASRINNEEQIYYYINSYPEYFNAKDIEKLINKLNTSIILYLYYQKSELHENEFIKRMFINKLLSKEEKIYIVGKIEYLTKLFENEPRSTFYRVLDKVDKKTILSFADNDKIFEYIVNDLKLNSSKYEKISGEYLYPLSNNKRAEVLFNYLPLDTGIKLLNFSSLNFILLQILNNPTIVSYISDSLTLSTVLCNVSINNNLTNYISFNQIVGLFECKSELTDEYKKELLNKFLNRNNDLIECVGVGEFYLRQMWEKIDITQKNKIIERAKADLLLSIYKIETNSNLGGKVLHSISMTDECYSKLKIKDILNTLDLNEFTHFINITSDKNLVTLYELWHTKVLEDELIKRFKLNPFSINSAENIDDIYLLLQKTNKEIVSSKLDELLYELKNNNYNIYSAIINNPTMNNLKFIELYKSGFFNNPTMLAILQTLLKENMYVMSTINFEILSNEFISIGNRFLTKVTKYPDIQKRLINIKNNNPESYKNFKKILKFISVEDEKIFDRKMIILLTHFEKNNYSFDHELTLEEVNNLERYILLSHSTFQFSKSKIDLDGINPLNLENELSDKCDEIFKNTDSIINIKNIIFMKFFEMNLDEAKEFVRMYTTDINSIELSADTRTFVNTINEILYEKDINKLKELYTNDLIKYNVNNIYEYENELQKAYASELKNSMYNGKIPNSKIIIDGKEVEVIELIDNFKLLVHSTNAYSSMPMIDNNYYSSWNLSNKTYNHGICTALVSDNCLGFPPLRLEGDGCIFAFANFSSSSITNMAPYDLCSMNSDYELKTTRPVMYMTSNNVANYTRHTHSELVVERCNLLDNKTISIQPTYVIITNEMNELQKKNALKASREMNPPDGIPIIYLDFNKIVSKHKSNIEQKINDFYSSKDINIFADLLNEYESVKCTLFSIDNYDFIDTNTINKVIEQYIAYSNTLPIKDKNERLIALKNVLDFEKHKFDLIVDSGNRAREFDIDYENFIGIIQSNIYNFNYNINDEIINGENIQNDITSKYSVKDRDVSKKILLGNKLCNLLNLTQEEENIISLATIYNSTDINLSNNNLEKYIKVLGEYSVVEDNELILESICDKYNIPYNERERLNLLCNCLKDINDLSSFGDISKLRLDETKVLVNLNKELYSKDINKKEEKNIN